MTDEFKHLFQPLKLRHKTLKNRISFGAHTVNCAEKGLPTERHIAYYEERARGGAAMIVVEPTPIHVTGACSTRSEPLGNQGGRGAACDGRRCF